MASIKVNSDQWNNASLQEQQLIEDALKDVGLIRPKDQIVADSSAVPYLDCPGESAESVSQRIEVLKIRFAKTGQTKCELACDDVALAGAMWCAINVREQAQPACFAVVEAAKKVCYKYCKSGAKQP
jgi:hypothetical protein